MKANELRIDNIVKSPKGIARAGTVDIINLCMKTMESNLKFMQWFINFGFREVLGGFTKSGLDFWSIGTDHSKVFVEIGDTYVSILKYVHELQNFFFAVT